MNFDSVGVVPRMPTPPCLPRHRRLHRRLGHGGSHGGRPLQENETALPTPPSPSYSFSVREPVLTTKLRSPLTKAKLALRSREC
ncbi:hypothetical protein [Microcoleus sp. B9-D4]|uniref:hypothetical protein n=1 Tax=Microcoleus sp. B9-D4 TaxID=2818711 RepID=UPI002FCEECA5